MKKTLLLPILFYCLTSQVLAQETPKLKFEKVSRDEMTMQTYPNDTTAEAVILYDEGASYVKYDLQVGFVLNYERFVRIKILKQSGVSWGNFHLSLYSNGGRVEKLTQVKGTTFNLENGKIVKSELKKSAIFSERENKYWESTRLSMPSVKVGSVIDLKYSITSDLLWNLQSWKFQYTIPVKWSQYQVTYPEYFIYNHSAMGYHPLSSNKEKLITETINYVERSQNQPTYGFTSSNTNLESRQISYTAHVYEFIAKDVPAIVKEPYITSLNNYATQIKFELASTNFISVGGTLKNFTTSWNEIAKQLTDDDNFGGQLKGNGFLDELVEQLTKGIVGEKAKLEAIYRYVQQSIKWNGIKSVFADNSMKKAMTEKKGNVGSVNLLLCVLLNKAGIVANPVVLSTRENGLLSFTHPTISDCNYVIIQALIDSNYILLDATEPNLKPGVIPFRCLNGEGHTIKVESSDPVALTNPKTLETNTIELEIKDGKISGILHNGLVGLGASYQRDKIKSAGGAEDFFKTLKNGSHEFEYQDYQFDKLDSAFLPLNSKYKIVSKEPADPKAEILYIDPILANKIKENPFTSPSRKYPVDFGNAFTETYSMQLTIPEGYQIEELPKIQSITLENKGGQYLYQAVQAQNKIIVNQRFSIDKTQFLPAEYDKLKKFYDNIINKQAEKIILKKTKS